MFLQQSSHAKASAASVEVSIPLNIRQGAKYAYAAIGSAMIVLAIVSFVTQMTLADILLHVERLFGMSFLILFSGLSALASVSVFQLYRAKGHALWAEIGLQAANGISTLALTFTLLGISLGIGSLSNQTLTPESVQGIIGQLTAQFSMAFMTTVVGLPVATLFRAIISILCTKYSEQS
jgi:hypothetical protein